MGSGISYNNQVTIPSMRIYKCLNNRYHLQNILGCGSYSTVFQGIDNIKKKLIAIKEIKLNEEGDPIDILNIALMELNILKKINLHPNLIRLHSAFVTNNNCYFILDYLDGGDLRCYLKTYGSLDEQSILYIICSIGSALNHLHLNGILHRDVKPENIGLCSSGIPRLMDFGISLISTENNPLPISDSSSGTLPYLAPEVLAKDNYHSYQADFWSLGVIGYELFYNNRPFPRHCPINSITYVTKKYGHHWKNLKLMKNNITLDKLDTHTFFPQLYSQVQLSQQNSELNLESRSDAAVVLEEIEKEEEEEEKNNLIRPTITIPCHRKITHYDPIPSEQFKLLLTQLMEVDIPLRLGSIKQFERFEYHECFLKYGYHPSTISMIKSPLHSSFFSGYPIGNALKESIPSNDNKVTQILRSSTSFSSSSHFTPEVRIKLLEFSYTNSDNNLFLNYCRESWEECQTKIRKSGTLFSSQDI